MSKSSRSPLDARIAAAALHVAGQKGWEHLTIEAISRSARIPIAQLKNRIAGLNDIVPLISAAIDHEAFAGKKFSGAPHDLLFDIFMARFDVLQKYRAAIMSMEKAARIDPKLACAIMRASIDSVYHMIEVTKLKAPKRPVLMIGLTALYSLVFWAWRGDKTRDMAKTMATLDRGLRLTDKLAVLFIRRT